MPQMLQQIDNRNCQLCRSEDPITLHTVRHQGSFSHLCTACVLAHHPASFCPVCFDLFNEHSNTEKLCAHTKIMCLRCPAAVHLACLRNSSIAGFVCPRCADPSFSFFDFKRSAARTVNGRRMVEFNRNLTKQLVCAAEIASVEMKKAAEIARANAEKKAGEAMVARRKAKEAIERMAELVDEELSEDVSDLDDENGDDQSSN